MTDELTDAQQAVVDRLPASPTELANELGLSNDAVVSRVKRAREKGADIVYDPETDHYFPPGYSDFERGESRDYAGKVKPPEDFVKDLRRGGLTKKEMKEKHGISGRSALRQLENLRERGYTVDHKVVDDSGTRLHYIPEERDKRVSADVGEGEYEFALIGDTHLGSTAEHLEELHDFYDRCEARGITEVYHAGDISDGWQVHKGHLNVIKGEAAGWQRLLDYIVTHYPERDGITTYFIEGNHDRKYHRRNGIHFGEMIDRRRDDLYYIGDSQARIILDSESGIDLELIHPSGGKPYTQGYRMQTLYRERPAEDRPTIAGIGHLHGKLYGEAEGVEGFYVGCWKGLTTYGKRKGHNSEIGGWMVEIEIDNGELRRVGTNWVGYPSKDDTPTFSPRG